LLTFRSLVSLRPAYLIILAGCAFDAPNARGPAAVPEPDPEFGQNGLVMLSDVLAPGANDLARALVVLPSGELAVAMVSVSGVEIDSALIQLGRNGETATVAVLRTAGADHLESVVADASGAVYAAGTSIISETQAEVPILKFLPDGRVDPSFGSEGRVVLRGLFGRCDDPFRTYEVGFGLTFDEGGRLLLSGNATEADCFNRDMYVARLDGVGALDPTFGEGGVVAASAPGFGTDEARSENGQDVLALPDGEVIVVGTTARTSDVDTIQAVLWVRADDGSQMASSVFTELHTFRDAASDASGRAVIAGRRFNGTDDDVIVVRVDSVGMVDESFADMGAFVYDSKGGDRARKVEIDSTGRIWIAGYITGKKGDDLAVWRLTPDGRLDPTWDEDGVYVFDGMNDERAEGIAFDARGRAYVSGSVKLPDGTWDALVLQLAP
jgi:uncharacterized delta-60 repeat protein